MRAWGIGGVDIDSPGFTVYSYPVAGDSLWIHTYALPAYVMQACVCPRAIIRLVEVGVRSFNTVVRTARPAPGSSTVYDAELQCDEGEE